MIPKKMDTPPPSSSKDTKKLEKSIFIRTKDASAQSNKHLYKLPGDVDEKPGLQKKPIQPFIAIPTGFISFGAAFVAYNPSIIYAFNGGYGCISPEVFYLDVRSVDEGWKKGPSMSVARPLPHAIASNDKLYVMGSSKDDYTFARDDDDDDDDDDTISTHAREPWGEVLDPLMNNVWVDFVPHPNLMSSNIKAHAVLEGRKEIMVLPSVHYAPLYSYDTDSEQWRIEKPRFGSCQVRGDSSNFAVMDDILYYYQDGDVRAYNSISHKWIDGHVGGLNKHRNVLLPSCIDDDSHENVFLVNLGNGKLCLIWINIRLCRSHFWKKYIRCTKFRVIKHSGDGGITLHALIDSFSEYTIGGSSDTSDDGEEIVDCFAM